MPDTITASELRHTIEDRHGCRAGLTKSELVKVTLAGSTVWEGLVHIFDLAGHPEANQAYAWASPVAGSDRWRPCFMLHLPPVTSAVDAVRAAIVANSEAV